MRIKIRSILDNDKPVSLINLKPIQKIEAGLIAMWHNTEMYKVELNKKVEESNINQIQQDEKLKNVILAMIYRELIQNKTLSSENTSCESIIISVDARHSQSLKRVLKHKDFLAYNVSIVDEDADIRKAFKSMPILLKVSKKTV